GRRRVAQHRVDAGDFVDRKLRPVEPDGGFRFSTVLFRQIAEDAGRADEGTGPGAVQGAGDDHLGVVDGLWWQIAVFRLVEELRESQSAAGGSRACAATRLLSSEGANRQPSHPKDAPG